MTSFDEVWSNYLNELRKSNVSECSRCKSAARRAWDAAKADSQQEEMRWRIIVENQRLEINSLRDRLAAISSQSLGKEKP